MTKKIHKKQKLKKRHKTQKMLKKQERNIKFRNSYFLYLFFCSKTLKQHLTGMLKYTVF